MVRTFLQLCVLFGTAKGVLIALCVRDGNQHLLATPLAVIALVGADVKVALLVAVIASVMGAAVGAVLSAVGAVIGSPWLGWAGFAVMTVYTAVNVPVARVFGTPLTYPMWMATGGALADSIWMYVTTTNLLACAVVGLSAALAPAVVKRLIPQRRLLAAGLLLVPLAAGVLLLHPYALQRVATRGLHRNALGTLVTTSLAQLPGSRLWSSDSVPQKEADGQRFATNRPATHQTAVLPIPDERLGKLRTLAGAARGRSVIWIVLESTAAQYLRPYGAQSDPMPTVTQLSEHREALRFQHVYAVYPESIKGLYATLCSAYPTANTPAGFFTQKRRPCVTLADSLAQVGYRTAMFHSGWFAYLGMAGIVADRGFSVLADAGQVGGQYRTSFGVDEATTVAEALRFVDAAQQHGQPFFLMYLPITGHHPYESPGKEDRARPFPTSGEQNRYLNDLHFGDGAIRTLREAMVARGLDDSVLWVVSGDHGEAFQQHPGNFAHTLYLYEENVHVPLLLVAPGLPGLREIAASLHGQSPQVGSLLDVVPTVLELLGLPIPPAAEGHSLLDGTSSVARFYTDQAQGLLGVREGPYKAIFEPESGRLELYNLDHDPHEQHSLAGVEPQRAKSYREHLQAFWLWQQLTRPQ